MGGGGLGMPNLCALTTVPPRGQLRRGFPRLLVGYITVVQVVAGGGPAAHVQAALTKLGTPYVWAAKRATTLTAPR